MLVCFWINFQLDQKGLRYFHSVAVFALIVNGWTETGRLSLILIPYAEQIFDVHVCIEVNVKQVSPQKAKSNPSNKIPKFNSTSATTELKKPEYTHSRNKNINQTKWFMSGNHLSFELTFFSPFGCKRRLPARIDVFHLSTLKTRTFLI